MVTVDSSHEVSPVEVHTLKVFSNNEEEPVYNGMTLLLKLVSNIVKDPKEAKFRSFKKTNAKV